MADLPDVLSWIIRRIARKVRANYGHSGYSVHDLCMK
jgi:hypothetical protein